MIEYHEKDYTTTTQNQTIDPTIINDYFTGIFQTENLASNPTIDDIQKVVSKYSLYDEHLDRKFTYDEINFAIANIGRGIGLDGLDKNIAHLFQRN